MAKPGCDVELLRQLWAAGASHAEIAAALGCAEVTVGRLRVRYGLPPRPRKKPPPTDYEPTQEEIAAHCARFKAQHLADKLANKWRQKDKGTDADDVHSSIRRYSWNDQSGFTAIT